MNENRIWIMNHYATNMYYNAGGRHYWFAENLIKQGYEPTIFCANVRHNTNDVIYVHDNKYSIDIKKNIPFVFVKTPQYSGNGKKRILNMVSFYKKLFPVAKKYAIEHGKPDVIFASSVHPLTLVAGIKIAKKFGIPCICEVRDLWPESLVAYGSMKRNSLIYKILYQGEKWIYKKADRLIFTMQGGKEYIIDQGWDKDHNGPIDVSKVYHINNGVPLESFNYNKYYCQLKDIHLENPHTFKVIYTGSIRLVNNVKYIIDAAKEIKHLGAEDIEFIIYGDGDDKQNLINYCKEQSIKNVVFKGYVDKKYIPYILSKSDLNIIHFEHNNIKKYGASLNKMFEYFASGKPTISDCEFGYDLIKKYNAGMVIDNADSKSLAEGILFMKNLNKAKYAEICSNALEAAKDYDFKKLTDRLISIIEGVN